MITLQAFGRTEGSNPSLTASPAGLPSWAVRNSASRLLEDSCAPLLNVVNLNQGHAGAATFAGDYRGISSRRKRRYDSRFQVITRRERHCLEFVGLGWHVFPVVIVLDERSHPRRVTPGWDLPAALLIPKEVRDGPIARTTTVDSKVSPPKMKPPTMISFPTSTKPRVEIFASDVSADESRS